jgi:hydrogenase maturation protein HypF
MSLQKIRKKIMVNGIVQGVGFRPFVYKLAQQYLLTGSVANTSRGVEIEVEGPESTLDSFLNDLQTRTPPLAVLEKAEISALTPQGDQAFVILSSSSPGRVATQIAPDVAVCGECLTELFTADDRRYLYPFINCTNCGPRYTIIENIPYDRPSTSMRDFTMCSDCLAEYHDPTSRRFHAQPNCCPVCGPRAALHTPDRQCVAMAEKAVTSARNLLMQGHILAVKGLGGFHLAVDATNEAAVAELRRRKGREEKPLAVMVATRRKAMEVCLLNDEEITILTSPASPIVLARKKRRPGLADGIAPGTELFGIMLPYTPLHHLLMNEGPEALVMTSGNISDEPICIGQDEAFTRLASIADFFLIHNRGIYLRNDDSVVINLAGKTRPIRRSRGYVPKALPVKSSGPPILALGGELKNSVCLLQNDQAVLSQHQGDLINLEAYAAFQKTIDHLLLIFEAQPALIVHDLHPQYLSSRWAAEQQKAPVLAVQHHHAHLAACLAENDAEEPAIGIIMDGTGYGTDATIWGGEVLIGDSSGFRRFACFEPLPLPGGEAAIREPWRLAVSWLYLTYGRRLPDLPFLARHQAQPIIEITEKSINSPLTSSCGRIFDAVAAMSGGRTTIRYEAQAAIEFMQAAGGQLNTPYAYDIVKVDDAWQIATRSLLQSVVHGLLAGESLTTVSRRFHRTLIDIFTDIAVRAGRDTGIKTIALSGGVFQNQLLFVNLIDILEKAGFIVLSHSLVPTNDGGLSLGQAMIGRNYLKQQQTL